MAAVIPLEWPLLPHTELKVRTASGTRTLCALTPAEGPSEQSNDAQRKARLLEGCQAEHTSQTSWCGWARARRSSSWSMRTTCPSAACKLQWTGRSWPASLCSRAQSLHRTWSAEQVRALGPARLQHLASMPAVNAYYSITQNSDRVAGDVRSLVLCKVPRRTYGVCAHVLIKS